MGLSISSNRHTRSDPPFPPNGESYKEFTKCLTLIFTEAKLYPINNVAKGAPNLCGEPIVLFHLPSKEVPRGKMGRIVETIDQGISNRKGTHSTRRKNLPTTKWGKLNIATNTERNLGRVFTNDLKPTVERATQTTTSVSNSYSHFRVEPIQDSKSTTNGRRLVASLVIRNRHITGHPKSR